MTSYDLSLALIAGDWHHTRLTITNILEAAFAAIEKKLNTQQVSFTAHLLSVT